MATAPTNPSFDIAHLGHVEMLTDRFDESLDFFTRVYGLKLSRPGRDLGLSARLGRLRVPLAEADPRRHHRRRPYRLPRRLARRRWSGGSRRSRRRAARSTAGSRATPATGRPSASRIPSAMSSRSTGRRGATSRRQRTRSALKNTASRFHAQGACPRRIDHVNLLGEDVTAFRGFIEACLGSRVTELIQLDNGRLGGCWFTCNNKTYDLACTEERGRGERAGCTTSPTPPTSARTSCAPPTSSSRTASISRPGRTSTRSRARSSSMSGSRRATGWSWPMPARG